MSLTLLALLAAAPAEAKPIDLSAYQGIVVDYEMSTEGNKTCKTVFKGTGADPVVEKDRITFTGTWTIVEDSCDGATVWSAGEGKPAHHTLRLDAKGKAFEEWVVHAKPEDHERFTTDIKLRGQYWINELAAENDDGFHYTTTEERGIFPVTVNITHDLKVTLSETAPEAPAKVEPAEEAAEAGD